MKKKTIVVEIIEEMLSPYGFHFLENKDFRTYFCRDVEGVRQNVIIQKSYISNDYVLELSTSADPSPLRTRDFVRDPNAYDVSDFLSYSNEAERREVLKKIGNIVIKYGIDNLNSRCVIVKHYKATPEMQIKLFEERDILTEHFMKRLEISRFVDKAVLSAIKTELEATMNEEYEQIQHKLVELAAVFGNLLIRRLGGKWKYNKNTQRTSIDIKPLYPGEPIAQNFVDYWEKKDADAVMKDYGFKITHYFDWINECQDAYGQEWITKVKAVHGQDWQLPLSGEWE